jgi:hypothetical protein
MGSFLDIQLYLHPKIDDTVAGAKKMPKVYSLAVHPTQPQYVIASTNAGVAMLCLEAMFAPPAAPLPLTHPVQVGGWHSVALPLWCRVSSKEG